MFDNLNDENVVLYSMKAYNTPNCILSEYQEDQKRFNYLNRLFTRCKKENELKERLIINHLIILNNVFGHDIIRLLFFKIYPEHYSILKTFLIFLNLMPEKIYGIDGKDIISSDIQVDMKIVEMIRKIK